MSEAKEKKPTEPLRIVAGVSEHMLLLDEVCAIVRRKKSWVYAEVAAGRFPASDDGRWYRSEVMRYLRDRRAGKMAGTPRCPDSEAA